MNVSLTEKQQKYIADQIAVGDYQNASELVRDALRLHQRYREKVLDDLRIAIEAGWNGPQSQRTVKDIVAAKTREHNNS